MAQRFTKTFLPFKSARLIVFPSAEVTGKDGNVCGLACASFAGAVLTGVPKEVSISGFLSLTVLEHAAKRMAVVAKKAIILSFIFFILLIKKVSFFEYKNS